MREHHEGPFGHRRRAAFAANWHGQRPVDFGFGPEGHGPAGPHDMPEPPEAGFPPRPPFPPFPGRGTRRAFPEGPRGFGPGGFAAGFEFGPGFRGRGHGRGRGGRARRGDVRAAVLTLLAERPMHGYEMIKEIAERSGGWWRPSPGSVYPTLQMLADEGLVTSDSDSGKRLYSLTEDGAAEAAKLDGTPPWEQGDERRPESALRDAVGGLINAVQGSAASRDPELVAKTAKILTEARKQVYLLLADADPTADTGSVEDAVPDDAED